MMLHSVINRNVYFEGACYSHLQGDSTSFTLLVAPCSSKTFVCVYQITQSHIPEDHSLNMNCHGSLKYVQNY
jgi:hypothetical protein